MGQSAASGIPRLLDQFGVRPDSTTCPGASSIDALRLRGPLPGGHTQPQRRLMRRDLVLDELVHAAVPLPDVDAPVELAPQMIAHQVAQPLLEALAPAPLESAALPEIFEMLLDA